MSLDEIQTVFRESIGDEVRLLPEGIDRYRVFTPFQFDDGDCLAIVLRSGPDGWLLTDEGHTFMHLTYWLDEADLRKGTRAMVIGNALTAFGVQDREGELVLPVPGQRFGDALFSYVQALLKISDVSFLTRERIRSTFLEDFRAFLEQHVPSGRLAFDWHDHAHDPEGNYVVDCRVNGMARPLFVFALPTDDKVQTATIAVLQHEKWGIPHRAVGIFENQEDINRKVLARFSDVCEKQFSSLSARDRIQRYLQDALAGG
jgi:hypothetical protein